MASPARRKEYKSEYKNKFRPFSQYEYVGEGKFFNTSNSPPSEADGPSSLVRLDKMEKIEKLEGEPWYKEVQELRKVANDYKCRGWGTDLVPPHMSQIYTQQLNLHEQAAKRESLSALALAISTPRSLNKEEKERENQRKLSPAPHAPLRLARPKTAPSKAKKSASRPESAQASPITRTDKTEKENLVPAGEAAKKGISRASSKGASRDTSRPPSAIENHMDYFREPVVKSPPEPTRVKSPEQLLMRSPDPINWTVPLDTGKTFSVTQSVRDSDSARNSPMSDHSSHFDSVSGTAINLGMHSVNEKGSLHYPKVSALAREAKELQGKSSQKKDDKVEKATVSEGNAEIPAAPQDETPNCTAIESESSGYVTASSATAKVNGTTEPSTNGEEKEQKDKNDNKTAPIKPNEMGKQTTNLKCLEDPTFSFDEPKPSSVSAKPPVDTTANPSDSKPAESGPPKKPSYRVLEDPELDMPKPKGSPYKVLEDPMTASFYEPAKAEGTKGRPEEVADG